MTAATARDMRWTDIPELVAIDRDLFGHEAWSESTWWSELAGRPQRSYRIVTDTDGIVGYAGVDLAGDTADIMTIAVRPRARGRGLAQGLLEWMRSEAAASGAEALLLEVRADNMAARKLYDRNGFAQINVRRRYYQPDGVDALIMRLLLEGER